MITDDLIRFCQQYPGRPVQLELADAIVGIEAFGIDTFDADEGQVVLLVAEEEPVALIAAQVSDSSWLHEARFERLLFALRYAARKTNAIPALAKVTAEEAASLFTIMRRGWEMFEEPRR
jgi:hypothetical protein